MKNIILIFSIFYLSHLKAQIIVEYKVELDTLINLYENKDYRRATKNVEQLDFILKFDGKNANYYTKEILSSDNRYNINNAIVFAQGNNYYYIDLEKSMSFYKPKDRFIKDVIVADSIDKNWKITKDKKKIGDFLCYKAIGRIYQVIPNRDKPLDIRKKYSSYCMVCA
jgi:GLPGLI family protein